MASRSTRLPEKILMKEYYQNTNRGTKMSSNIDMSFDEIINLCKRNDTVNVCMCVN